ncbi:peptide ABC transporter substrate-binding protein [Rhodocista pekingensis]|uniref:Peptide ABC transporter substrate-binding protein n=1 Tax=Rhodocista pekingensis TaxID=201185 RepID=A0ABW2KXF5_9PROT
MRPAGRLMWLMRLAVAALLGFGSIAPAAAEMVLHRGNGTEPETLDPQRLRGEAAGWIAMDLFEGLLTVDAKGHPIPGLAESWTVSDDGLVYTFILRQDARWSDGSPVTAEDFAFSWRRLLDPDTLSDYAYFLWPVKNGRAINLGQMPPSALGVEAVDDRTFRVTLEEPATWFVSSLQHTSTSAISKASYERHGEDFIKPGILVSSGAYRLAEAVPQGHVKLVRNPHFHAADTVAVDTVYFYPTENRETELRRFRAGELDLTYDVPDSQLDWLKANMADELHIAPYLGNYFYAFNLTRQPWASNRDLRKALVLAVDRTALATLLTKGGEEPAFTFVPPRTAGYTAPQPDYAGWTQAERDAEAQRLVAAAGYGKGGKPLEVEILFNTSENHRKIAIAIAAMWQRKLGATVVLTNQEWKVFIDSRNNRTFRDVARHGWVADFDDAVTFLKLFRSDIGRQNPSGYANPAFDRLMDAAGRERDPETRQDLMRQAEALLLDDLPIVPIFYHATQNMVSRRVRGWEDNLRNLHLTRYLRVE